MSPIYAFPIVATLSQLLPTIAVAMRWRESDAPRRWVAVWGLLFFASDIAQIVASRLVGPNWFLFPFINPLEDALTLWILSYWQVRPFSRLVMRIAIPFVLLAYILISMAASEVGTYQTFSGPFRALVILTASLFTLVSRIAAEPESVLSRDWSWVTMGFALYYGVFVAIEPVTAAIGDSNRDALIAVYSVRAVLDTVAFILIWRGMRCPLQNGFSGST
jgi:hypothetical protein